MPKQEKFIVEKEEGSWVPLFNWFWRVPGQEGTPENPLARHGAYPAKWIATLSAWIHTR
jgi:hypothetical protein